MSQESSADGAAAAERRIADDLTYLASDELAGRGIGSEGITQAGEFIAKRFAELGFVTDTFNGEPFQRFSVPGTTTLGAAEDNRLAFTGAGLQLNDLKVSVDFNPLALGKSGEFSGPVAFAGYGITASEYGYDDYGSIDAKGKVVIVIRKEPQQSHADSRFEGTQNSQYAYFTSKELNAALHQAAALLLVNDAATAVAMATQIERDLAQAETELAKLHEQAEAAADDQREQLASRLRIAEQRVMLLRQKKEQGTGDTLLGVNEAGTALSGNQVPTFYCARALADRLLQASGDKSLAQLEALIDQTGMPHSFELQGVQCAGEASLVSSEIPVHNVIAVLPGSGSLANEYVVVGAHYDHVGMGGQGSLAPGTVAVHNGADDNASGTVALLEIAHQLSQPTSQNRRTVLFMAFSAEESGLLGSEYYVRNPRWPLEQTVAMINLDMVGRLHNDELTVYGTGTATEFKGQIDRWNEKYRFNVVKVPQGRGASDHASFYDVHIPVYHFFTGLHNDYHRPSDDVDRINVPGIVRISSMVSDIVREIAESPARPQLLEIQGSASPRSQSGTRPRLGVRLDRSPEAEAAIMSVIEGSPAAAAGLQAGDTVVQFNGAPIRNVGELQNAIRNAQSGASVEISFRRENVMHTATIKLGE